MADYFTHFSFILPLPSKEAQSLALALHAQARAIYLEEEKPKSFPKSLIGAAEDWNFDAEAESSSNGCGLWLHTEYGGVDAVCAFARHLLKTFDPTGHVGFEWSHDCSRPEFDAFGGGAALITARRIQFISTGNWLHKQQAKLPQSPPLT